MPARSVKQRRYFGMVAAGKIAKPKGMTKAEVDKFASTKEKGLPMKARKKRMKKHPGDTFTMYQ